MNPGSLDFQASALWRSSPARAECVLGCGHFPSGPPHLHVPKPVLTCSRHLIKCKQNYINITIQFLSCTSWISGAQWLPAAQRSPVRVHADSSAGRGWPGAGSLHAAAAHDARLGLEGEREGSPSSAGPTGTSRKPMNRGMVFSTEPARPCPTLSCCALLTGLRRGLGLAQGHTAGGGGKGLRSPDSALAAPQHPLLRLDSQQSARLEEVFVYRKDFFLLINESQKHCPGVIQGTAGHSCRVSSHQPQGRLPGHHGMTIRLGKGQGQGSSPGPLFAGPGGTSATTPSCHFKAISLLCS